MLYLTKLCDNSILLFFPLETDFSLKLITRPKLAVVATDADVENSDSDQDDVISNTAHDLAANNNHDNENGVSYNQDVTGKNGAKENVKKVSFSAEDQAIGTDTDDQTFVNDTSDNSDSAEERVDEKPAAPKQERSGRPEQRPELDCTKPGLVEAVLMKPLGGEYKKIADLSANKVGMIFFDDICS